MADFKILMKSKVKIGTYEQPGHPTETGQISLIVERAGDVLTISPAKKIDLEGPDDELSNRRPIFTLYGLFLFNESASLFASWIRALFFLQGPRTYFLLVREVPAGAPAADNFFALDGVAYVQWSLIWRWRLRSAGRHDHILADNSVDRGSGHFAAGKGPSLLVSTFDVEDDVFFKDVGGG